MIRYFKNRLKNFVLNAVYENELAKQEAIKSAVLSKAQVANDFKFSETLRIFNLQSNPEQIRIAAGTYVRGELLVFAYGGEIIIGENSFIGEGSRIWSGQKIIIGNNVLVSHNCNIVDTNSHEINHLERAQGYIDLREKGYPKEKGSIETKEVVIGDYTWISFNSTILKGVKIGKGVIIGANSVVTCDIPDFSLAVGNPARIIRQLD